MCRQEYKFWEQKNALSAALCETRTKGRLIHHIDHGTWFNPWMASITWIFIWSQNLKKKKHLGLKAVVLERVSFFWTSVLTGWVLWGQRETFWPALVQSDLWGFGLLCLAAVKKLSFMLNSEGGRQLSSQMASVVSHEGKSVTVTGNGACGWTDTKCYVLLHAAQEGVLGLLWIIPFWTSFSMCSGAWRWRWARMNGKFTNIHIRLYI